MIVNFSKFPTTQGRELILKLGKNWYSQLYVFADNTIIPVLESYLNRLDCRDLCNLRQRLSDDVWAGTLDVVDYFMQEFEIKLPVDVVCDQTTGKLSDMNYLFSFDIDTSEIIQSELVIPTEALQMDSYFYFLVHGVWYIKQQQATMEFFQKHGTEIDLDLIEPSDPENRGLIYHIQRLGYINPEESPFYYLHQLIVYEAMTMQNKIFELAC